MLLPFVVFSWAVSRSSLFGSQEKLDKMRGKNEMMMADEKRMQEYLVEAESVVNAMQFKLKDLDQGCAMLRRCPCSFPTLTARCDCNVVIQR